LRKIEVVPYDENWKRLYSVEEKILRTVFGKNLLKIHHVGSTAIPGLSAKPIIDILIEVNSLTEADSKNSEMSKIGYSALGEYGIKGRRFFRKGDKIRTHHIHLFQENDENLLRHIAFRDYLLSNQKRLKEYEELKIGLAIKYPYSIDEYCDGKNSLILEIEKEALNWSEKYHTKN